jgi:hypothetical protein
MFPFCDLKAKITEIPSLKNDFTFSDFLFLCYGGYFCHFLSRKEDIVTPMVDWGDLAKKIVVRGGKYSFP